MPHPAALVPRGSDGPADPIGAWLASPLSRVDLAHYAALYRGLGWNVLPVAGKTIVGRWKRWQQQRVPARVLARMLDHPGVTGLAVLCGWVSGWPGRKLGVRDFDAAEAYHRWAARHPALAAALPTVRTRRGYHVYSWVPAEVNRTFRDGELRASSGGYVLLPPSFHPEGGVYAWEIHPPLIRPADMPLLDPRAAGRIPDEPRTVVGLTPRGVSQKWY